MKLWPGQYYNTTLDKMLAHLALAEEQLAQLAQEPVEPRQRSNAMSASAFRAKRKREVIAKLKQAIRARVAWHHDQIALAAARGIFATGEHEPKRRSRQGPGVSAHA
jgi:hypothetical protein